MSGPKRLHVFVLIDALGWKFIEGRPFLSDLLTYRAPTKTILGFSSGAIPTILTGLPPAQTGHWNLFYYDPQGSPFRWLRRVAFLPECVLDHRVTRKLLKEIGRRVLNLGPLFECCVSPRLLPWFNWVEKRNIYDRGGITGARSVFDLLVERGIPYRAYSYHHWNDEQIFEQARHDVAAGKANFFFLYLSELDRFLHVNCHDPSRVEERLVWYEARLRELFQFAQESDPRADLSVFSDHGMTPVRERYDLMKAIEALGFAMPRDYLVVYDSTLARFWFFAEGARRKIVECLEAQSCGQMLPEDELRRMGVFFPDGRYGEVIFLLHPGWLLARSNFNGNGWMPAGMHGYHPDDAYSDGIFLSNRLPTSPVRTIANLYSHMWEAVTEER